jgi:tryptophan-rich sensory protein
VIAGGISVPSIVATALAIVVTAGSGAALTATALVPWYRDLRKPSWNPPNWVFGPAWTLIFALTGTAAVLAWNAPRATAGQRTALVLALGANLALNVLWSTLFFYRRRPDLAQWEVVVFWVSIVALIAAVRSLSPNAAWLLAPYLLWVSFAAVLNRRIVTLNAPFL